MTGQTHTRRPESATPLTTDPALLRVEAALRDLRVAAPPAIGERSLVVLCSGIFVKCKGDAL
jgi:hypothetical protein